MLFNVFMSAVGISEFERESDNSNCLDTILVLKNLLLFDVYCNPLCYCRTKLRNAGVLDEMYTHFCVIEIVCIV